ncbi:MAG: TetR/AcrR family transcriptional regulator [Actinomycetes bacterium]
MALKATPPLQARSIATEQKMLDAAEQLLQSGDSRQVTVENVTKLSGAKVSSFYARFGSVEGLFDALQNRFRVAVYQTTILQAFENGLQQTDLKSSLIQVFKPLLELARRENIAISYFFAHPTVEQEARAEQRKFMISAMHKILQQHQEEIVHKDLRRASENVSRMAYAMWTLIALEEPSMFAGRKTSLSSVIELTSHMAYAYLTTE